MAWNNIQTLGNGSTLDFEIFNDIIENLNYLKSIIPDVRVRTSNGYEANSETGSQMKIQTGSTPIATFTGRKTIYIPFVTGHNGKYVPSVVATVHSGYNMNCQLTKVEAKGFYVTLTPVSKKAISGVRLNWIAITQLGG